MAKYFFDCTVNPHCKLHLKAWGEQMFETLGPHAIADGAKQTGGTLFTRFMIAGFATYHALEKLGVTPFEGYPYIAFRLWMKISEGEELLSKKHQAAALACSKVILQRIAKDAAIEMIPPKSLDKADAAILAITLAHAAASQSRVVVKIAHPPEGKFVVALDEIDSAWLTSSASL
jgi:hypothetical protein